MTSLLCICGSTRVDSSNLRILKFLQQYFADQISLQIDCSIADIPAFNPDFEDQASQVILEFRQRIREQNAILICTPEYAAGVPGALKNALDWTVGTAEFYNKRVGVITASTRGIDAHSSLIATMRIMGAKVRDEHCLLISGVQTKVAKDGSITDHDTQEALINVVQGLRER